MNPGPSRTVAADTGLLFGSSCGIGARGAPSLGSRFGCSPSYASGGGHDGLKRGISSTVRKPPKSCARA